MMEALVSGGPLAVSIMTYDDFSHYSGGVYHHVESNRAEFDPFHVRLKIICIRNNNFVIFYLKIEWENYLLPYIMHRTKYSLNNFLSSQRLNLNT